MAFSACHIVVLSHKWCLEVCFIRIRNIHVVHWCRTNRVRHWGLRVFLKLTLLHHRERMRVGCVHIITTDLILYYLWLHLLL